MAGAAVVIRSVIVVSHIDHRPRFNIQLTVLKEGGVLLPRIYLNVARYIHCAAPGIVAQRSFDDFVHLHGLSADLDLAWFTHRQLRG
jgi:hypothetical protein